MSDILIVEDERRMGQLLQEELEDAGLRRCREDRRRRHVTPAIAYLCARHLGHPHGPSRWHRHLACRQGTLAANRRGHDDGILVGTERARGLQVGSDRLCSEAVRHRRDAAHRRRSVREAAPGTGERFPHTKGFSDLVVTAGWRVCNKPDFAVLVGVTSTMPTATETGLGLGKNTVGPSLATARVLPDWDTFLIGLFTQQVSVGGDPSRKDVNISRLALLMTTLWKDRWWSTAQTVLQCAWERKGKTGMVFEFEVGRNVVGTWGVFVRPGVGIFGQGVGTTYDWNIEVGVRRTFKSF